ncbi:spore cortex biosynthesis protein YabQ [Paludifilum halophilum]|uniref:Spore cortex biosynthesis protein YabQ n=1 Tax=Paludifilum halophilum TaxID=1642702 RepID=A0A235B374_9BACL|nr:spore cortex biosynthesis protein YabQ [Paludifilum halophilum]OYD06357.1 spore cortex biosynthesis protein YabQ [Paludifilum halophilum]
MTLHTQWVTMGLMLGSGWLMGFLLDTYRVFRHRFRLRGWVVSFVDLLYWTVAAGLVFGLLMWSNWGELRFYIFVAVLLGLLAYYAWFSRGMIRGIQWLLQVVEQILQLVWRVFYVVLWVPVAGIVSLLRQLLLFFLRILRSLLRFPLRLLSPLGRLFQPIVRRVADWFRPVTRPLRRMVVRIRRWFHSDK